MPVYHLHVSMAIAMTTGMARIIARATLALRVYSVTSIRMIVSGSSAVITGRALTVWMITCAYVFLDSAAAIVSK